MRLERPALAFAVASAFACLPAEEDCFRASREVHADEVVRGHVVSDLITRYLARHEGTLTWQDGGTTALSLELEDEPGNPYNLYEAYECDPRLVSHWLSARVITADGAFDNAVPAVVAARFPYSSLVPDSVVNLSTLAREEWNESVSEHLSFDPSHYVDGGLQFVLDWPADEAAPTSGHLDFRGSTASTPPLVDTIRVGDLAF